MVELIVILIAIIVLILTRDVFKSQIEYLLVELREHPAVAIREILFVILILAILWSIYFLIGKISDKGYEKRMAERQKRLREEFMDKYNLLSLLDTIEIEKLNFPVSRNRYFRNVTCYGYRWIKVDNYVVRFCQHTEEDVLLLVGELRKNGIFIAKDKYEQDCEEEN